MSAVSKNTQRLQLKIKSKESSARTIDNFKALLKFMKEHLSPLKSLLRVAIDSIHLRSLQLISRQEPDSSHNLTRELRLISYIAIQVSANNVHHLSANFTKVILFTYLEALDV